MAPRKVVCTAAFSMPFSIEDMCFSAQIAWTTLQNEPSTHYG